jgi:hypothetical protein
MIEEDVSDMVIKKSKRERVRPGSFNGVPHRPNFLQAAPPLIFYRSHHVPIVPKAGD